MRMILTTLLSRSRLIQRAAQADIYSVLCPLISRQYYVQENRKPHTQRQPQYCPYCTDPSYTTQCLLIVGPAALLVTVQIVGLSSACHHSDLLGVRLRVDIREVGQSIGISTRQPSGVGLTSTVRHSELEQNGMPSYGSIVRSVNYQSDYQRENPTPAGCLPSGLSTTRLSLQD